MLNEFKSDDDVVRLAKRLRIACIARSIPRAESTGRFGRGSARNVDPGCVVAELSQRRRGVAEAGAHLQNPRPPASTSSLVEDRTNRPVGRFFRSKEIERIPRPLHHMGIRDISRVTVEPGRVQIYGFVETLGNRMICQRGLGTTEITLTDRVIKALHIPRNFADRNERSTFTGGAPGLRGHTTPISTRCRNESGVRSRWIARRGRADGSSQ